MKWNLHKDFKAGFLLLKLGIIWLKIHGCILPLSSIWLTSACSFYWYLRLRIWKLSTMLQLGDKSYWRGSASGQCHPGQPAKQDQHVFRKNRYDQTLQLSPRKKDPTNDSFGFQTPLKLLKTVQQSLSHNVTLTVTGIKQHYYIKGMHEKDQFSHCLWINNRKLIFFLSISEWKMRTLCEQIPLAQI